MSDFPKFQGPNAPERLRRAVLAAFIGTSYADIERELGVSEEELLAYWALPMDPVFEAEARAALEERIRVLRSDDMRRETAALLLDADGEGIVRVSRPEDDDVVADWVVWFDDAAASTTFDDLIAGTIEFVRDW